MCMAWINPNVFRLRVEGFGVRGLWFRVEDLGLRFHGWWVEVSCLMLHALFTMKQSLALFTIQVSCPAVCAPIARHLAMHLNYACHTCEWIASHRWTESYHTCMRYVTHVNGPCQMHQFVTSHMWMHYTADVMSRMFPWSVDLWIKMVRDSFVTHTYVLTHRSWAMSFPWCLDLWMCFLCGVSIDRST